MSLPDPVSDRPFEPRWPGLAATAVFILAMLTLCWPMLAGQFLLGDDQYIAGYAFRKFGAEMTRATGSIPQWNPYLFGGMPFVAAQHGDIFYPTAWLRLVFEIDTAMNLGFAIHFVIAGGAMYALLRGLRVSWAGSVVGGVAYELTGILASLVRPGHDGKLFVSALAPLVFLALVYAVRERRIWGYGLLALTVGLCMVSPHYQMTYYLLVAAGLWTLYLVFWDPERPAGIRWPVALGAAFAAVVLGVAIAAIQIVPFLEYIPYSPRGAGGPSGGWEYATSYSFPPAEVFTTILPQFNGVLENYWGSNFFKLHTEYLGALVVLLAVIGWRDRERRRLVLALTGIGVLFLLVSFGGHTPFYRLWYAVMPMMQKVRAPGMAFFLVALIVAVFAGFGADRLFRRSVSPRNVLVGIAVLGGFALLGALGILEGVGRAFVEPQQSGRLAANAAALQGGALRLLLVALAGGAVIWAVAAGRLRGRAAAGALIVVVGADLWTIDRLFLDYRPPAERLFADDEVTTYLRARPKPFRVLDAGDSYQGSILMGYDIQTVLGYHGQEVRYYDNLLGGKNVWQFRLNPNVLELVAAQYLILPQAQEVPGFHQVAAAPATTAGAPAVLYERDSMVPYVRVVPAAAKVPEEQIVPTILDPRFPLDRVLLYPDSMSLMTEPLADALPEPAPNRARLAEWAPGRMRITLEGSAPRPTYLLVSETWYPDWRAMIDGQPAQVHRADEALLSVVLPPGAREVALEFRSDAYALGRIVTLVALALTAALLATPLWLRRRTASV